MIKAKKRVVKRAKKFILPTVLSELIEIALKDIRKAEKLPNKYVIDMSEWYEPKAEIVCETDNGVVVDTQTTCVMCAAGSVMAFSLANESQKKKALGTHNFPDNEKQLLAIDYLRQGEALSAYYTIHGNSGGEDPYQLDTTIPEYERANPEPFHRAMKAFQKKLTKAGY